MGSVLDPFLNNGLSFAILQPSGKADVEIDRLQIWEMGNAKFFAPSFKNFPDILSIPEAFFVSNCFSVLSTDSGETFSNSSLSSANPNEL